jgi:hypothetical protein
MGWVPPAGDLRWPLGGWLRRVAGGPTGDSGTPFGWSAAYSGPKGLRVIGTTDLTQAFGPLVHISVSYADRDPTWAEIKAARAVFFPPTMDAMMVLPAEDYYVNLHPHTFHVIQMPERWGLR